MTKDEIRQFALETAMALENSQGNGKDPSQVVADASIFETYVKYGYGAPLTTTGNIVTAGNVTWGNITVGNSQGQITTGGTPLPTVPGTALKSSSSPTTEVKFAFDNLLLDQLDAENFDLIEEFLTHLSQFHRVAHFADGSSLDLEFDTPTYPQGAKKRGIIYPNIITTARP